MRSGLILYIQYTNPAGYPPLEHSSKILADRGFRVLFLGTTAFGAWNLAFPPHPRIRVRLLPRAPRGWLQKAHYVLYALWVLTRVALDRPLWVYCSDPFSAPVALLLTILGFKNIIYHEHDSPGDAANSTVMRWVLAARRQIARRVRLCVLPNKKRAERFARALRVVRDRVACVWNCPRTDEVGPARNGSATSDLWLYYHGSVSPDRLPETVVRALSGLPRRVRLRIVGYETAGNIGYLNRLLELARELQVAERIDLVGPVPRAKLLELAGQCDVGLAFVHKESADVNMNAMVGASNKPFDYLARGLALLVTDLPEWRQLYIDSGCGMACDPADIAHVTEAVRWLMSHPREARQMGETGRFRILRDWNYETQFRPIVEMMTLSP